MIEVGRSRNGGPTLGAGGGYAGKVSRHSKLGFTAGTGEFDLLQIDFPFNGFGEIGESRQHPSNIIRVISARD